jgi:heme-degrading monooxygenase HmoA
MYRIVWAFDVRAGDWAEFERIYGPEGEWAQLFRKAAGYQGSDLLRDVAREGRYVTIDRWQSRADFQRFYEQFAREYRALDERCERLTSDEQRIGEFEDEGGKS